MSTIKKIIIISYGIFSFIWIFAGIYGMIFSFVSLVENGYQYMNQYEIFGFWALILAYLIVSSSLIIYILKSFIACFKKREIKYRNLWLIFNAIFICLIPTTYTSVLWYQILGKLSYQPIIYFIKPFLSSEFFCIVTMLNILIYSGSQKTR